MLHTTKKNVEICTGGKEEGVFIEREKVIYYRLH
jgi:hypothetical protein